MQFPTSTLPYFTALTTWILFGLCSCKPSDSGHNATAASSDCTLETPLKPGVPGSPGNLIPSAINPNGHSELAHLMREMQEDMSRIRDRLLRDEDVGAVDASHKKIRCAWPTEESMRDQAFDLKAQSYLATIDALERAGADQRGFYNAVVGQCISCHNTSCPGPITAIRKLQLPN